MPERAPDAHARLAGPDDAAEVGRLLHAFNTEYGDPSPGPEALAERLRELLATDETFALLAGAGPGGMAIVRLRPSLWSRALDAYLEELYVVPARRGQGLGGALLDGAMRAAREAGAVRMEVGTSVTDTDARALYERRGFTNREGGPDGPAMLFYERELG